MLNDGIDGCGPSMANRAWEGTSSTLAPKRGSICPTDSWSKVGRLHKVSTKLDITSLGATVDWDESPRSSETAKRGDFMTESNGASKHKAGAYLVN